MFSTLSPLLALIASLLAAAWDARTGRIPNGLTLPLIGVGLSLNGAAGANGLALAVAGLVACGFVPLLLYRVSRGRGIGGGDVKLFAGLGALLGPMKGLEIEFGAFVVLACFALVRLAYAGQLLRVLANTALLLVNPLLPARSRRRPIRESLTEIRMGPAIAVACLTALYVTDRVESWLV
jgi:prepilin peptidase CpaA